MAQNFWITLYGYDWVVNIRLDMGDVFEAHALIHRSSQFGRVQYDVVFCVWQRFQRTLNGSAQSDFCITMLYQDEKKTHQHM